MDVPVEPAASVPPDATSTKDERMWAMFAHLAAFAGLVLPPVGHIVGPLVIWLIKREAMPLVNDQGKEALNFQITMTIAFVIAGLLCLIAIGFVLLPLIGLFDIILTVIAAVKANEGVAYRYPATIRFLK